MLEDRDSLLTRLKYYFEPAARAQKRFDNYKMQWGRPDEPHSFHLFRNGGYYIIQIKTGMFPMPPPVWFAKKKLRPDQIVWLEDAVKSATDIRPG